jgi:glyoxylase-like metal-dependent hydrolase (beta-lactamase superfamily II)
MRVVRFLLILLVASTAHAEAPVFSYQMSKIAEGMYAFIDLERHAIVSGNTVAIIGDDAVLVVDTGQHPPLTRQIVADIRKLTAKPVKYVVNTHWHNDHIGGNFVFKEEYPGVKIVTHAFTAEVMDRDMPKYTGPGCTTFITAQSRIVKEMLDTNKDPEGKPLAPDRRERLLKVMKEVDYAIEDCNQYRYVSPDTRITEKMTIDLGKRVVELLFLGRANTAGDLVVYVPDAKIAVVGDIVVHPFPFATQSYIGEWGKVLRKVIAMDTVAIVPGHGPVMKDKAYITDMAELMESIDAQAKAAYVPGMSFAELRKKIDLDKFMRKFAGDDKFIQANFDAMIGQSAVKRAWEEASGKWEQEGFPPPPV